MASHKALLNTLRYLSDSVEFDITVRHIQILVYLHSIKGETSLPTLRDSLELTTSTCARLCQKLGEGSQAQSMKGAGLVISQPDPMNLRFNVVGLTKKGAALMDGAMELCQR